MIFHWMTVTTDVEYGDNPAGLQHEEKRPFAVTLTFEEMKHIMHDPHYIHLITYTLAEEIPEGYKGVIQR